MKIETVALVVAALGVGLMLTRSNTGAKAQNASLVYAQYAPLWSNGNAAGVYSV